MVRVGDQSVAILQPACESNPTHWLVDIRVSAAVLPDNLARVGVCDLDGAVVVLVADKDVAVLQEQGTVRVVELVGTVAGNACGAILPGNLLG